MPTQGINYNFTGNTNSLESAVTKATQLLTSYGKSVTALGTLASLAYVGSQIATGIAAATKESINFVENLNLFNVVMGQSIDLGNQFISQLQEQYGMDPNNIMRYTAVFYQLSEAIDAPYQASEKMSLGLTKLGIDMASLFNIPVETVMLNLQSGMQGLTRAIRKYGLDVRVVTLQAEALKLGITANVNSMTEANRQGLRYILLMKQASNANSDFAKTIESPANQLRILGEQLSQLARAVGDFFIGPLTSVLPYINGMVMALRQLLVAINAVLGFKPMEFGGVVESANDLEGEVEGIGTAADKTAKKIKNLLMPFDELNILKRETTTDNGLVDDSMMDPKIAKAVSDLETKFEGIRMKANQVRDAILEFMGIELVFDKDNNIIGYTTSLQTFVDNLKIATGIDFGPLVESFGKFGKSLKPIGDFISSAWKSFVDEFLKPLATWVIEKALPTTLDLISGALDFLSTVLETLKPAGNWLWNEFLKPIGEWVGQAFIDFLKWLTQALKDMGEWIKANPVLFEDIIVALGSFAASIGLVLGALAAWKTITTIGTAIGALANPVTLVILALGALATVIILIIKHWDDIKAALQPIWDFFVSMWDALNKFSQDPLVKFITALVSAIGLVASLTLLGLNVPAIGAFFMALGSPIGLIVIAIGLLIAALVLVIQYWDDIKIAAGICLDWILTAWRDAGIWFENTVLVPLKTFFVNAWEDIKKGPSETWTLIKGIWILAATWFDENVLQPIIGFFTTAWNGIKSGPKAAWTLIKGIWFFAATWFNTEVLQPIIGFFATMWSKIETKAKEDWENLKAIWNKIAPWVKLNVTDPVAKFFTDMGTQIKSDAAKDWEYQKKLWGNVDTWFNTNVKDPIVKAFTDAWAGVKKIWGNIGDWFKNSIVNPIRTALNDMISYFETGIQSIIDSLNKFSVKLPGILGGQTIGFNIPDIHIDRVPMLATGGIVNGPTLAMLGESGPEAVVPLSGSNSDGLAKSIADAIDRGALASLLRNLLEVTKEGKVLQVDRKVMASLVTKSLNSNFRTAGYTTVEV